MSLSNRVFYPQSYCSVHNEVKIDRVWLDGTCIMCVETCLRSGQTILVMKELKKIWLLRPVSVSNVLMNIKRLASLFFLLEDRHYSVHDGSNRWRHLQGRAENPTLSMRTHWANVYMFFTHIYEIKFRIIVVHCDCRQTYTSRTLVGNKIVDHLEVVGTSRIGAAPTTASFLT